MQNFEIFENTLNNLQEIGPSSNQEGSSPLFSQLSATVVRQLLDLKRKKYQLLDLKKERKDQLLDLKKRENIARGTTDPGYCLFNLSYLSS